MSETNTATIDALPFEGKGLTVEEAAANLLAAEDSDEEHTEAEQPEAVEEVETAEEVDESDEDADDSDIESDEESESTPEDESKEPDDPFAEKERQRQADYTRKTQALAEERKAFEAERAAQRETLALYADRIEKLDAYLASTQPAEPDWTALREKDPVQYAIQREDWRRQQEDRQAVEAEKSRLAEQQAEEQKEAFRAYLEDQRSKLYEAIPEWKDAEKATAEKTALYEAGAREYGFTDEDFASVVDHRLLLLLRDAVKYRELSAKGKEVVESKRVVQKVLQPGNPAAKPKGREAEIIKLRKELKRTGSPSIAQKLFELMED
jgi:hypothetical protein